MAKNAFGDELPETGRPLAHVARLSQARHKATLQADHGPAILDKHGVIRIGISIAAGNKAKTVPPVIWKRIVDQLADLPCEFYVFGAPNEQSWMDDITRLYGDIPNFTNLIGKISLEELPRPFLRWTAISRLTRGMSTSLTPSACRWSCCLDRVVTMNSVRLAM